MYAFGKTANAFKWRYQVLIGPATDSLELEILVKTNLSINVWGVDRFISLFSCRRPWKHVRLGFPRWSSSSSSSRSSSWRGWKMPQHGPSWGSLSTCCWPSWRSFLCLSQLWLTALSPWWRPARAPSPPCSSSSCWPSCGGTGTRSQATHTARCSLRGDQTGVTICYVIDTGRGYCSHEPAGNFKIATAAHIAARPGAENSSENIGPDSEPREEEVKSVMLLAAISNLEGEDCLHFWKWTVLLPLTKRATFLCVTKSMIIIIISNNIIFIFCLILFSTM